MVFIRVSPESFWSAFANIGAQSMLGMFVIHDAFSTMPSNMMIANMTFFQASRGEEKRKSGRMQHATRVMRFAKMVTRRGRKRVGARPTQRSKADEETRMPTVSVIPLEMRLERTSGIEGGWQKSARESSLDEPLKLSTR